jgi:cytochrome c oxidase subunit 2
MTHRLANILADGFWLPAVGSPSAERYHFLFHLILYITGFFFLVVVGLMLTFVVRYRRRAGQAYAKGITHNTPLEITWTAIPLIVVIAFFYLGFRGFMDLEQPPSNALVIDVEAGQWSFNFNYPNGSNSNNLYVPVGQPVVINLRSKDVLHSLYIPAFSVQKNAVPGRTTQLWFTATTVTPKDKPYTLFCTQYCGTSHSLMGSGNPDPAVASFCYALSRADYDAKMEELGNIFIDPSTKKPLPYREVGQKLYKQSGCASCHSVDGSDSTGPTYKGLYKSDVEYTTKDNHPGILRKSDSDAVWDQYLRESVLDPGAKIVKGRQNVMPPEAALFSGSPGKDKRLAAIIEYIKSLGPDYQEMPTPAAETAPATAVSSPAGAATTP